MLFKYVTQWFLAGICMVLPSILQAGGTEGTNTLLGTGAGASLTIGINNTFIGNNAGNDNTSASSNTFVGDEAGAVNTTGQQNTFIGLAAGDSNTTANFNTFVGVFAGTSNTTGTENTFLGAAAGFDNTTAGQNTFVGDQAGEANTTGAGNTFIGEDAGVDNTTGLANTFIGEDAGFENTIGERNTYIGHGAGLNATGSENVFVGDDAGANESGSNKLYIESSSSTTPLIYGEFDNDLVGINGTLGVGTQLPQSTLHVRRSDNTANLRVEETLASTKQVLFNLVHNGFPQFNFTDTNASDTWTFRLTQASGLSAFSISKTGTGEAEFRVDENGDAELRGMLTQNSSRSFKQGFTAVNGDLLLSKLEQLPLSTWEYKREGETSDRHMGPMAEDFHELFGLGQDDKHIAPSDLAGVALASAKELQKRNGELRTENKLLVKKVEGLEEKLEQHEAALGELKKIVQSLTYRTENKL